MFRTFDTARVMSRFARAIVIRTFADEDVQRFAAAATIPVINALTDGHHPMQSLADVMTVREKLGGWRGRRIAYVGDGNNVAHSLMEASALAGLSIAVATPEGYGPSAAVVQRARGIAMDGASVIVTNDPGEGVADADAVYTDVWTSMGQEVEYAERKKIFSRYQVNDTLMARAKPNAVFLHCLPAHRGEEVTDEVIESPASVVFTQAENRLHAQKALLLVLVGG